MEGGGGGVVLAKVIAVMKNNCLNMSKLESFATQDGHMFGLLAKQPNIHPYIE